jgi:hypothetical protein
MSLHITLHEGSHPDDVCDYCRKQTGHELITLDVRSDSRRHSRNELTR